MTLSGARNQTEYQMVERLLNGMDSRSFSPDVFALALVEMSGFTTGVLWRTVMLYIANFAERAKHIDPSGVDDDTLDALDQAIRLASVLTEARADGRL